MVVISQKTLIKFQNHKEFDNLFKADKKHEF